MSGRQVGLFSKSQCLLKSISGLSISISSAVTVTTGLLQTSGIALKSTGRSNPITLHHSPNPCNYLAIPGKYQVPCSLAFICGAEPLVI